MPTLITNAEVFGPEPLGRQQILIDGSRIAAVAEDIDLKGAELTTVDAEGAYVTPGFVDALTHPCGGGGEGGFQNRTAEVSFETFVGAGVTSPVGALGTDSITRSLDVLFGNVMQLRRQGLAALMYTGSYRVPANTLTGDVARDVTLIDPVIGVGEVAIADHRSSQPTICELRRLAADARLGGIIGGKSGVVLVHVGDGRDGLARIREAIDGSELPARSFYPTHANRNRRLFEEAVEFSARGGFIDFTASTVPEFIDGGELPALQALDEAIRAGAPPERLTISSDAGGSLPVYRDGELTGLTAAAPDVMLDTLLEAMERAPDDFATVVAALTRNPADALGLPRKGRIAAGFDADILIIDSNSRALSDVLCGGEFLMRRGTIH